MCTALLEQTITDLQSLPEPDRQLVLGLVQSLKRRPVVVAVPRRSRNPALQLITGALVFTGEIGEPDTDWLRIVREEREEEMLAQSVGQTPLA